jgi:hypothetical protein
VDVVGEEEGGLVLDEGEVVLDEAHVVALPAAAEVSLAVDEVGNTADLRTAAIFNSRPHPPKA